MATARYPTDHALTRMFIQGLAEFASRYYPDALPEGLLVDAVVPFAAGPPVPAIGSDDPRAQEVGHTLNMDFENYTLGHLFSDRGNYDMTHHGHQDAAAHVRGTVWALGWRESGLGEIDRTIVSRTYRADRPDTERYGKKYGWVGYYTYAGAHADQRGHAERLPDVDIDPSFPVEVTTSPVSLPSWATPTPADAAKWIRNGRVEVPDDFIYRADVDGQPGVWFAVYGHLAADTQTPGRRVFGLLTAMLVAPSDSDRLVHALKTRPYPGNWWLPRAPSDYYTFSGEMPWSLQFGNIGADEDPEGIYRGAVEADDGTPIEVEILAHEYAWESYHSELNRAGGALVPSRSFSLALDLRGSPQTFNQFLPDRTSASLSFAAPAGFDGHVLYPREDLVHRYAAGRTLVSFLWGERELWPPTYNPPGWLVNAARRHENIWRCIQESVDVSPPFARERKRRTPARQKSKGR